MILSIGMMVKNEEKNLERCLKSLIPIIDKLDSELIIVDTGSEDNTVAIAKKYTKNVYFHEWNNNFSEMRNTTISYCQGEWFLCIDADEVIEDSEKIIEFFTSQEYKKYNTATITVRNYLYAGNDHDYNTLESNRLFKKSKEFKYVGAVHNQPIFQTPIKKINCIFNHYGYIMDDEKLMKKKYDRTVSLLKKELSKDPGNIYYRYQLISSYSMGNKVIEALKESDILYELLDNDSKKIHKYVLTQRAQLLVATKRTYECEKLCAKELELTPNDEIYKIDLMYYLAKSQFIQGKFELALENYRNYFKFVTKFEKGELPQDTTLVNRSISLKNYVYSDMIFIYYVQNDYENVIKYSFEILEDMVVIDSLSKIIKSFINLNDFNGLYKYYINLNENIRKEFCNKLEEEKLVCKSSVVESVEEVFSQHNSEYGLLNKIRLYRFKEQLSDKEILFIENFKLSGKERYYGDIIYILLKNKGNIEFLLKNTEYSTIISFFEFCNEKYCDFSEAILSYLKEKDINKNNFDQVRINVILCRIVLIIDQVGDEDYKYLFNIYEELGIIYVKLIYSEYVIDNEIVLEARNNEDQFLIYILRANRFKENNTIKYIEYLKKALSVYPYMKKGIEFLINQISKQENEKKIEMENLKKALIENINLLISLDKIDEANNVINEYEEIMGMDMDLILLKSRILLGRENVYFS